MVVEPYVIAGPGEADELVAPLRELGPAIDMYRTIPMAELIHAHMDPEHPVPGMGDHQLLEELTAETIDAMIESAGPDVETALLQVEIRHLGGAVARPLGGNGALACIDAPYATFAVGMVMGPEMAAAVAADLAKVRKAFEPWEARQLYLNFAEHAADTSRMFDETAYARLRAIKAAADPDGLFVANHGIA